MIPTEAYRDEGTSYHYIKPADYIQIKNANKVAEFMSSKKFPCVLGKTWTTDSFYIFKDQKNVYKKLSILLDFSA